MSQPTISDQQIIADLQAARNELVVRGRSRGKRVRPDGTVCALGAISVAVVPEFEALYVSDEEYAPDLKSWTKVTLFNPRVTAAEDALNRHVPEGRPAWSFNDQPDTTDQDVLNLFDKALAELGGLA